MKQVAKESPWVLSDVQMWENIISEWESGNNVLAYRVDGPTDLVASDNGTVGFRGTPHRVKWWVCIYLREQFMLESTKYVLQKHPRENPVLVLLQNFHWNNVTFLLRDPPKLDVWNRYVGRFKRLNATKLEKKIRGDAVLLKYWERYSIF